MFLPGTGSVADRNGFFRLSPEGICRGPRPEAIRGSCASPPYQSPRAPHMPERLAFRCHEFLLCGRSNTHPEYRDRNQAKLESILALSIVSEKIGGIKFFDLKVKSRLTELFDVSFLMNLQNARAGHRDRLSGVTSCNTMGCGRLRPGLLLPALSGGVGGGSITEYFITESPLASRRGAGGEVLYGFITSTTVSVSFSSTMICLSCLLMYIRSSKKVMKVFSFIHSFERATSLRFLSYLPR